MLIAASEGTAQWLSPKNSRCCPVTFSISALMMPSCGSSIHCQTRAATTPEIRNGRMIRPRITVELVSRCSTTAVISEKSTPRTTETATK